MLVCAIVHLECIIASRGKPLKPLGTANLGQLDSASLAEQLASLGYPGFRQLAGAPAQNPAKVLFAALAAGEVEVRVTEALPWLVLEYADLDWEWLVREAKAQRVQNRLGFVVTLARQVAEAKGDDPRAAKLRRVEGFLDEFRLPGEDTLCQALLSRAERRWLRQKRTREAAHWNLLTDLRAPLLPYVT